MQQQQQSAGQPPSAPSNGTAILPPVNTNNIPGSPGFLTTTSNQVGILSVVLIFARAHDCVHSIHFLTSGFEHTQGYQHRKSYCVNDESKAFFLQMTSHSLKKKKRKELLVLE